MIESFLHVSIMSHEKTLRFMNKDHGFYVSDEMFS